MAPYDPFSEFTPAPTKNAYGGRYSFLRDLDGDGDLDLLYIRIDGSVTCIENTGTVVSPVWQSRGVIGTTLGSRPGIGDVDADGDMDLMLVHRGGLFLQRNHGIDVAADDRWGEPQRTAIEVRQFDDGELHAIDIVDATGAAGKDGFVDLIVVHADGQMTLMANDGDDDPLTWMPPNQLWTGSPVFASTGGTMGDIEMDGDLDWFAGVTDGGEPRFRVNLDEHLLMFPRYFTIAHGNDQIIEVGLETSSPGEVIDLQLELLPNNSKVHIDPIIEDPLGQVPTRWRYIPGSNGVGVDIIRGQVMRSDGTQLVGIVVVNVI